jgi:hypothetical protein
MFKVLVKHFNQLAILETFPAIERVENIAAIKSFTLQDCKNEIVFNWTNKKLSFLNGIKVREEELEMLLKVADCLTTDELQEETIPIPARKEICRVLGCDMEQVNKFIILHKTHRRMHEYLIARLLRKENLPRNEEEIKKMMLQDPLPRTKTSLFISKRRVKISGKQKKFTYNLKPGGYARIN